MFLIKNCVLYKKIQKVPLITTAAFNKKQNGKRIILRAATNCKTLNGGSNLFALYLTFDSPLFILTNIILVYVPTIVFLALKHGTLDCIYIKYSSTYAHGTNQKKVKKSKRPRKSAPRKVPLLP